MPRDPNWALVGLCANLALAFHVVVSLSDDVRAFIAANEAQLKSKD
jgi:hypothetical protein